MKNKIFFLLRITITFTIIFIIWWSLKDNFDELLTNLRSVNKFYLFLGFFILLCAILFMAVRLKMIFSTQDLNLDVKEALSLIFIGFFFNNFLPTAIGGDIVKAHYASEKFGCKKIESYAAVFADRFVGLISIISIALISSFIIREKIVTQEMKSIIFIIFLSAVFFGFFLLHGSFASKFKFLLKIFRILGLEEIVKRSYRVLNNFKNYRKTSVQIILVTLTAQIITIVVYFILAKSLDLKLPLLLFFLFVPIIGVVSMIPSFGGTGPREGAFVLLFSPLIGKTAAVALALLWLSYFLSLSLIGGVIYILNGYQHFGSHRS